MTYTQILIIDQLVLDFGFARFRINAIRINEGPLYHNMSPQGDFKISGIYIILILVTFHSQAIF